MPEKHSHTGYCRNTMYAVGIITQYRNNDQSFISFSPVIPLVPYGEVQHGMGHYGRKSVKDVCFEVCAATSTLLLQLLALSLKAGSGMQK